MSTIHSCFNLTYVIVILIIICTVIESESIELTATLINDGDLYWPEIETIWRQTVNYRLQFIKENNTSSIFKKWIHYTKPLGYKLVSHLIYY